MEAKISGKCGGGWARHLVDNVKKLQFEGQNVQILLTGGWLEKEFIIKGDEEPVRQLSKWILNIQRAYSEPNILEGYYQNDEKGIKELTYFRNKALFKLNLLEAYKIHKEIMKREAQ